MDIMHSFVHSVLLIRHLSKSLANMIAQKALRYHIGGVASVGAN